MLKPSGSFSAKIVFILDYPSGPEADQGFSGAGYVGHYLQRWLKEAGSSIVLQDCYVTHFITDPLPGKIRKIDEKNFPAFVQKETGKEWQYYRDQIIEKLSNLEPNLIFVLGEAALQGITGESQLDKYRGTIMTPDMKMSFPNPLQKVFPLYHPRAIHLDYKRTHIILADIIKGLQYKHDPKPYQSDIITWVCRSATELDNYFSRAEKYIRDTLGAIMANDIETYYNFITAMGYSFDGKEGVSIPLLDPKVSPLERALINYKITSFHNDSGIGFVGHNYIFDTHHMARHNYIDWDHFKVAACTMDLGKIIYPEFPASLAFYNSIYTLMPYFKDEGKEFDPAKTKKDQLYHYNAKDCISTNQVYHGELKDAEEEGVLEFWKKRSLQYFHFYRKIDARGVLIDDVRRLELIEEYQLKIDICTTKLRSYINSSFNPLSPKQCKELIYDDMRLPQKYKRSPQTGKQILRTDETILVWFLLNLTLDPVHEDILNNLILVRHYYKYISYLNPLVHPDGYLRTHYKPSGTESGRSSTNYSQDCYYSLKEMKKGDFNVVRKNMGLPFQTIPKHGFNLPNGFSDGSNIREIFVPPPGFVFWGADQSSAEARVVGILSEDELLLEKFEKREDIHYWTASFVLEKPQDTVTKTERQQIGKPTRHAGNYAMQAEKLAEIAQLRLADAKRALENFHRHSPNIRNVFHKEIVEHIKSKGSLSTHLGRKRQFFGRLDNPETHRQGFSYIPQSVVSDNQKNGMIELEERLGEETVHFIMEAHDGCVGVTKKENLNMIYDNFQEIMERKIVLDKGSIIRERPFVIPIDKEWSDTNLKGMKKWQG